MSKILIPTNGYLKVTRNELSLDPNFQSNLKKDEQVSYFSNPQNHYVYQVAKNVNSVNYCRASVFYPLNIHGTFEIQSHCDFCVRINEKISNDNMNGWSHLEKLYCKNFIVTIPDEFKSKPTLASIYISDRYLEDKDQDIETISIKASKIRFGASCMRKVREITLDGKQVGIENLNCPKLKKLNLPRLERLPISNIYTGGGLNIFSIQSKEKDFFFDRNNPVEEFKDNVIINLPKTCKLFCDQYLSSPNKTISMDANIDNRELQSFINKDTSKSYIDNKDGTFGIMYGELKSLVSNELISRFEESVTKMRTLWNTEKTIFESMYIKQNKSKEK